MLLMVTDTEGLALHVLDSTDSTSGLGAKDCLLWDHARNKFGATENYEAVLWVQHFLEEFDFTVNVKLSRTSSVRLSWKNFNKKPVSGEITAPLGYLAMSLYLCLCLCLLLCFFLSQFLSFSVSVSLYLSVPVCLDLSL